MPRSALKCASAEPLGGPPERRALPPPRQRLFEDLRRHQEPRRGRVAFARQGEPDLGPPGEVPEQPAPPSVLQPLAQIAVRERLVPDLPHVARPPRRPRIDRRLRLEPGQEALGDRRPVRRVEHDDRRLPPRLMHGLGPAHLQRAAAAVAAVTTFKNPVSRSAGAPVSRRNAAPTAAAARRSASISRFQRPISEAGEQFYC